MRIVKLVPFVTIVAAVVAGGITADPASAAVPSPANPGGPMKHATGVRPAVVTSINSPNWAGYAVSPDGSSPGVISVSATWTQPAVTCPTTNARASFWVGLDGLNNSTVEQIGTEAVCTTGATVYRMWWEMFPNISNIIMTIRAGDSISASVGYSPGADTYILSINDNTQRRGFSTVQSCPSGATCNHNSVEWIAEAPSVGGSQVPLANYGSATFTNCTFIDDTGATNTPNSRTPFLRTRIFQNDGTTAFASPGSTSADGRTFTDSWRHQ
jgi:hypothetical protein